MAGFSLAKLFGMTIRESANDGSDFTNPDADYRRLFLGEDGALHLKDSSGTVTAVGGSSATGSVEAATVATNETRSSATMGDLATVGPAVTIDVPASGEILIHLRSQIACGSSQIGLVGIGATGANSITADEATHGMGHAGGATGENAFWGASFYLTGLTPGSTTFTMKYKSDGTNNVTFLRRQIIADTRNL